MPEIKIKHVVSFSSEDKVHKAENLIKPETYRKWKCATPGEKSATIVLQFEKAIQIHSIDIGNESSAFVEVLVGRSSYSVNDYQVLLVASSFMSPLESRDGTHGNRVRMFGPEKLSRNVKDEKWDCVQIVCTQPFNKTIAYGLTFIKFHSQPEKIEELSKISETSKAVTKLGAFKIKYDDDDDDNLPSTGTWFGMKRMESSGNSNSTINKDAPSYAAAVLSSKMNTKENSSQDSTPKRKPDGSSNGSQEPPMKKPATTSLNEGHIIYKTVLDDKSESKKVAERNVSNSKTVETKKTPALSTSLLNTSITNTKQAKLKKKVPFHKIMENVVIVLSGFVNPLRSELRDRALKMGAKYQGDWNNSCTHLICAFMNTPKYFEVKKLNGKIVQKDWIIDCYKKKELLPWNKYILDESSDDSSEESEILFTEESEAEFTEESEDSEEEYIVGRKRKNIKDNEMREANKTSKKNLSMTAKIDDLSSSSNEEDVNAPSRKPQSSVLNQGNDVFDNYYFSSLTAASGSKNESETEDEDAIHDYMADTDVDSESGGDTEDEIRKVEMKAQRKAAGSSSKKMNGTKIERIEKPDVTNLPLPDLPNMFKKKYFFLYGDFTSSKHDLLRYITAYNGVVEDYMHENIKYVITESKWDKNFEDALSENEDLIFVKPAWIYKCHEVGKFVPFQPYIIIPNS